ncbi:MAG TPA: ABC transporter substrate-binding protein [Syntrophales bacterium]|nr:ABC transporter substrate-binding protein [Syntrophales bacterium]
MKKVLATLIALTFVIGLVGVALAQEDTFDVVKKRGTLIGGVKDSTPGFGYIDPKTREIVGYDVDFLAYIAKKMGVKLELKSVTSATRIPQLMAGNVDIVAATMTITSERAKQIDFSYTYFLTGQKFLVRKGTVKSLADLEGKRIGTAKGSTSEQNAAKALPKATVLSFDDYPQAFLALQQNKVVAVTTDESILANLLAKAPNKDQFELTDFAISDEPYGLGVKKGNPKFLKLVNDALLEMERNGEARKLFEKWFGPNSDVPMKRNFKITAGK